MRRYGRLRSSCLLTGALAAICGGCVGSENCAIVTDGDQALVVTTDYRTGGYTTIGMEDHEASDCSLAIHPDAVCRYDPITATPLMVSRLGADAVEVLDPRDGWRVANEYSVGAGTNAQDIAVVSAGRAYVLRYGHKDLLVVHPTEGTELGTIDLTQYADPDGLAEPAWAVVHGDKVYVALHRLDNFEPADFSSVIVMDGPTGRVEAEVRLSGVNPFARMRYSRALDRIVIGHAGLFGKMDGGVEFLDQNRNTVSGFVIGEQNLGGDLADVVVLSETKGYAVVSETLPDNSAATRVVSFNPGTGRKIADLAIADGFDHSFLELTPDGSQLWITERTRTAPGVRIFDTSDDHEITSGPIDVGLPPFMICFVPG